MDVDAPLARVFKQSSPSAHEIALGFRAYLVSAHVSAASVNRHMATLRSVTRLGRWLGVMTWYLERARHEGRGATRAGRALKTSGACWPLRAATRKPRRATPRLSPRSSVWLRVSELCGLTLLETDLASGTTWILGKGRKAKELVPLPATVVTAIRRYLVHRGTDAGPLFQTRRDGKNRNGALETRSVAPIIRKLGQRVDLHAWCHSLRHTSITQTAELGQRAGLGIDKIRACSRHRTIATLMIYVDEHERQQTQ
jgi:integrase/recombinase XerC